MTSFPAVKSIKNDFVISHSFIAFLIMSFWENCYFCVKLFMLLFWKKKKKTLGDQTQKLVLYIKANVVQEFEVIHTNTWSKVETTAECAGRKPRDGIEWKRCLFFAFW